MARGWELTLISGRTDLYKLSLRGHDVLDLSREDALEIHTVMAAICDLDQDCPCNASGWDTAEEEDR